MEMLIETYTHEEAQSSGSAVQMAILGHNAGWDDSIYNGGRIKAGNIRIAYGKYLEKVGRSRDPSFYGANITCDPHENDPHSAASYSDRCGGVLPNQTQHYGYNIVAQHLLAVCYYAKNHKNQDAFSPWTTYLSSDSYCSEINVPSRDEVQ